ncbi:hypothetical protein [Latilactobacillus fuchuensis]|uniref:Uncharacterized protein n=1 Tax=Latilactobacillus fuchuensis TaxID=164393 RepID=A0A2N9DWV2_9LACO|nr:hypothetical protein [Latilactobacillus fuchuensis]SPC39155.1 hypothetical protein LFUMFP_310192 [Latilactobacillus fuchuensis]
MIDVTDIEHAFNQTVKKAEKILIEQAIAVGFEQVKNAHRKQNKKTYQAKSTQAQQQIKTQSEALNQAIKGKWADKVIEKSKDKGTKLTKL